MVLIVNPHLVVHPLLVVHSLRDHLVLLIFQKLVCTRNAVNLYIGGFTGGNILFFFSDLNNGTQGNILFFGLPNTNFRLWVDPNLNLTKRCRDIANFYDRIKDIRRDSTNIFVNHTHHIIFTANPSRAAEIENVKNNVFKSEHVKLIYILNNLR